MKILLVDDNIYILNSLQNGIDYNSLGFLEVLVARSLERAIEILEKNEIQAVVTDIEMPNGTGLELLEWINANKPSIVTVFCTSYADFSYAKKALELHSFDYYLKPIKFDDLYKILKRVVEEVHHREKENNQKKMGNYWLDNQAENKNYFWLEVLVRNYGYAEDEWEELASTRHLEYHNDNSYMIGILLLYIEKDEMRYSNKQFITDNILREQLSRNYLQLEAFVGENNNTWLIVVSEQLEKDNEVIQGIMNQIMEEIQSSFKCKMGFIYSRDILLKDCRDAYLDLEQAVKVYQQKNKKIPLCTGYEIQEALGTSEASEKALDDLKSYLEAHYNEKISQEQIAREIYYNLAYISKLFKRRLGMPIGNYILEYRIEMAKKMLFMNRLSVTEIAMEVGYDNFAYFSRLFKKKTGYTPREYRKMMKSAK
ncbi:response regulator transcription factor [Anaerocolumna xylanovorans]|uniref:Stage 0 sporulation protein A homolog n=1 Tax=Anaerocolumna xylanovorans DSM 12503 TaxID=1121345 RepID=A0A1M7Y0X4_9FIRM|nr:response regulator [Anaerocolumna xylanovorans]SHO45359.1 Two-component response regulator, YesN/AraC family, consists of REC and AraC-type DNA-binding domains [Anaerocolumna xylanovorans DSM 12503]